MNVKDTERKDLFKLLQSTLICYQYQFVLSKTHNSISSKHIHWTAKDKAIALKIYFQFTDIYELLRKYLSFPSVTTLKHSMCNFARDEGFCDVILHCLERKSMKKYDKLCIISFDTMKIKYNTVRSGKSDEILGHQNDKLENNSSALVFMARGIYKNWKQPIGFFIDNSLTVTKLKELLFGAIKHMQIANFIVVAVVCRQDIVNQGLYRDLLITPENPYFQCSNRKIFALYDPAHLLELMCNDFKKYLIHSKSICASWQYVQQFYVANSKFRIRLVPELYKDELAIMGDGYINTKLATYVFSYETTAGVQFHSLDTAEFIHEMYELFNIMNSKTFKDAKKWKSVFPENFHDTLQLKEDFIKSWKFEKDINSYFSPPCKEGWLITISAVRQIWNSLKSKIEFLLTNRLGLDCLRNTFISIEQNNGFKDNPSVLNFINALREQMICCDSKLVHHDLLRINSDAQVLIDYQNLTVNACARFFVEE